MARNYPASTSMQKCLEERYKKEESAQFEWFFRKKSGSDKLGTSKQLQVFKNKIEMAPRIDSLTAMLPKAQEQSFRKKRFGHDGDVLANVADEEGSKSIANQPVMYPVEQPIKERLYEGFSKEGKGRAWYLKERKKMAPEEKYTIPLVSSFEYGWCLSDVIKKEDIKKSPFARYVEIREFYNRNGIPMGPDQSTMRRSRTVT